MFWWIAAGLLVYIVGSYWLVGHSLSKGAGPAGLGWMVFPIAPVIPIMLIGMWAWGLPKRLLKAIFSI